MESEIVKADPTMTADCTLRFNRWFASRICGWRHSHGISFFGPGDLCSPSLVRKKKKRRVKESGKKKKKNDAGGTGNRTPPGDDSPE